MKKFRFNKKKVLGHFVSVLVGLVAAGAVAKLSADFYSAIFLYTYGLLGHTRVFKVVSKRIG